LIGVILSGIGLVGWYGAGAGWFEAKQSFTALIPAWIGVVLMICGLIVTVKDSARKHAMHVAAAIALLGAIGAPMRPIMALAKGDSVNFEGVAFVSQVSTSVLCLVFVVLAVRSFIAARRARQAGSASA
jgi:hypothetical protein